MPRIITTDSILIEVLNFFAEHGNEARRRAVSAVEQLLTSPNVEVVPQTHENFLAGLTLYKARADKGYSLTDCISMITMRERGVLRKCSHTIGISGKKVSLFFFSARYRTCPVRSPDSIRANLLAHPSPN